MLDAVDIAKLSDVVKKIEAEKVVIATSRDKLREYLDEVEGIIEDADEAVDDLVRATDALSKFL